MSELTKQEARGGVVIIAGLAALIFAGASIAFGWAGFGAALVIVCALLLIAVLVAIVSRL